MTHAASTPTATVTVDGISVPVTSVTVQSDTSIDLSIPATRTGAIAGADADFEWEQSEVVTSRAEHPWSPLWRAKSGAQVSISLGTLEEGEGQAFAGVIDATPLSLRNPVLSSSCVDPLANVDATFRAPALAQYMPSRKGSGLASPRAVNCSTLWYVAEAGEAIGARYQVPRTPRTVWRQTMAGSAYPSVGHLDTWSKIQTGSTPYDPPIFTNHVVGTMGRMTCSEPYGWGTLESWPNPGAVITLYHELEPLDDDSTYTVRLAAPTTHEGFGVRVTATHVQIITLNAVGGVTVRGQLLRTNGDTRIAVRCSTAQLSWLSDVSMTSPAVVTEAVAPAVFVAQPRIHVNSLATATQVGAIDVTRNGNLLPGDEEFPARRTLGFDMGTRWLEKITTSHPSVMDADAVAWLTDMSQRDQSVMVTDEHGKVWWSDPSTWPTLPVARTITDSGAGIDLDDLSYRLERRPQYSRVRVTGMGPLPGWPRLSQETHDSPNQLAGRVEADIEMEAGDPAEVYFIKPLDFGSESDQVEFWLGDIDTSARRAGEPTSESWHESQDFVRGRGSWSGGHVVDAAGDPTKWALPGDYTTTIEHIDYDTVKVTVGPGAGLVDGQRYINLPLPISTTIANSPVRDRRLPRVTTYGRTRAASISGVSANIPGMDPALPDYVHDAGWACASVSQCTALAQEIADRYATHPGVIIIDTALCDVRIGQRINVQVTGPAELTFDGVVIGIPNMSVSPGDATMRLRLWSTSVTRDTTTYAEHAALTGGMTWGQWQASGGTWGGYSDPAEVPGKNYGQSVINPGGGL